MTRKMSSEIIISNLSRSFSTRVLTNWCSLRWRWGSYSTAGKIVPELEKPRRKIQPIIITKDKMQKEVYGLGYPSLPVLSVDEFYEKRIEEGWWKPPSSGGAFQDRANDPELEARMMEEEEREEDDKEDDEEAREKALAMYEFKDDQRRGEGNRLNMG